MRKLFVMAAAALAFAGCCGKAGQNAALGDVQAEPVNQEAKKIRMNVFVTIAPGHVDEVVAAFNTLAAASQKEEGCIGYDIYQNTVAPEQIIVMETWESDAALKAHMQTDHYKTILPPLRENIKMKADRFEF